jgi:hypothetical protein
VDDRSIVDTADRACSRLYMLEYTGKWPLN